MPNTDATTAAADDSGTKSGTTDADAGGKSAGSKSKGKDAAADDDEDGEDADKSTEAKKSYTQSELDAIVQRRLDRATKKLTDDAKLTETQRLEKERDDALALVRERDLKDDFVTASGLSDASKAARLFRMYRDDMDVDDKGKVTNMKDVVKTAKADFPELFKVVNGKADAGGDAAGSGGSVSDMNRQLRKMSGRDF